MIGLIGLNWFNQNTSVGRDLWTITLAEGGGNPQMKVNPIYVKEVKENVSPEVFDNIEVEE